MYELDVVAAEAEGRVGWWPSGVGFTVAVGVVDDEAAEGRG